MVTMVTWGIPNHRGVSGGIREDEVPSTARETLRNARTAGSNLLRPGHGPCRELLRRHAALNTTHLFFAHSLLPTIHNDPVTIPLYTSHQLIEHLHILALKFNDTIQSVTATKCQKIGITNDKKCKIWIRYQMCDACLRVD
jgi:hypothetical protein